MMLRKLNISFLIFAVCLLSVTVTNAQQSKNDKNYRDMIAEYNSGNKTKAYDIALSYKYGWNEAPKNVSKAIEWLDKAFDAGIYKSATMIGTIYRTADGVNLDYSKAEKYYKKAAAKGDEAAMIRLGQMYYYGSGVKENYATAKKWYYEAAKKYADSKTKCSLACVFYADMNFYTSSNFKANYPEALKWYEKAFRAGYMEASVPLSVIYSWNNKQSDTVKGEEYLIAASQKGYFPAMQELVDIYLNGKYGLGNASKAYAWASLINSREDLLVDSSGIMKQAAAKMTASELSKAKKTAAALIKNLGKTIYPDPLKNLD